MKKLPSLLILAFLCVSMSYSQNPFEKFGYTPKMGTLSKGKYIEHFDQDSIVQIGSVLLNQYTKSIVGFVKQEKVYSEATLKPEIVSRWMSPDPLADEFPNTSPYVFTNNNPIRFIDPEGLAPIDVIINGDLAEDATAQLNASSSLNITRDAESGKLSATGTANTESDVALLKAINDQNVVVNLNASSENVNADGIIIGGVFGGSTNLPGTNVTFAEQQVNPNQAAILEEIGGAEKGSVVKHEVLEAYAGAVLSPGSPSAKEGGYENYKVAHRVSNNIYPAGDGAKLGLRPGQDVSNIRHIGDGNLLIDLKVSISSGNRRATLFSEKNVKIKEPKN